jgi:hypothetical protein
MAGRVKQLRYGEPHIRGWRIAAERLGDAQPVDRQQRDQRVLGGGEPAPAANEQPSAQLPECAPAPDPVAIHDAASSAYRQISALSPSRATDPSGRDDMRILAAPNDGSGAHSWQSDRLGTSKTTMHRLGQGTVRSYSSAASSVAHSPLSQRCTPVVQLNRRRIRCLPDRA